VPPTGTRRALRALWDLAPGAVWALAPSV